jgi:hypothetical protein
MGDLQTNEVLCSILEMLKQQVVYSHRLHGWLTAAQATIRTNPEFAAQLEAQPFYDQGPRPDIQITENTIRNIDALIRQLREPQ